MMNTEGDDETGSGDEDKPWKMKKGEELGSYRFQKESNAFCDADKPSRCPLVKLLRERNIRFELAEEDQYTAHIRYNSAHQLERSIDEHIKWNHPCLIGRGGRTISLRVFEEPTCKDGHQCPILRSAIERHGFDSRGGYMQLFMPCEYISYGESKVIIMLGRAPV